MSRDLGDMSEPEVSVRLARARENVTRYEAELRSRRKSAPTSEQPLFVATGSLRGEANITNWPVPDEPDGDAAYVTAEVLVTMWPESIEVAIRPDHHSTWGPPTSIPIPKEHQCPPSP